MHLAAQCGIPTHISRNAFSRCCPSQSAEVCRRIFVVQILEDFLGDFPGGFFWALFPTKTRRKNPARKSARKSGGPKIKIHEKSVLPKSDPKRWCRRGGIARVLPCFHVVSRTYRWDTPLERRVSHLKYARRRANREVQTVNWEGGGERAVKRGVKSSLKKAHKPWLRGKKGAQTVN